jgi:hypothetical protein
MEYKSKTAQGEGGWSWRLIDCFPSMALLDVDDTGHNTVVVRSNSMNCSRAYLRT